MEKKTFFRGSFFLRKNWKCKKIKNPEPCHILYPEKKGVRMMKIGNRKKNWKRPAALTLAVLLAINSVNIRQFGTMDAYAKKKTPGCITGIFLSYR
jgi:hypothetical protein